VIGADYFDGRSARAHPVQLSHEGNSLVISGTDLRLEVPLKQVQWPERTRHGTRVAHLPGGGTLHCADASAWDAFAQECGRSDSIVVRAQQSWRWVLASVAAMVVVIGAAYHWGVPWAARAVVPLIPAHVEESIGDSAMASLDEHLLEPSKLSLDRQQRLRAAFARAVAAQPPGSVPPHQLLFRSSEIGPNAFALPGGTMVMLDDLVELVGGDEAVLTGVLAHELGHVRHRHGLRLLVQVSAIGVISSAVLGDFSTLLSGVPVLLGQAAYTRDAEREADADAARFLKDADISPAVMVTFFEKIASWDRRKRSYREGAKEEPKDGPKQDTSPASPQDPKNPKQAERRSSPSWLGIAIASHPADAERIRFFQEAAARR
jgi:Zn-dependent protease with chaperone function